MVSAAIACTASRATRTARVLQGPQQIRVNAIPNAAKATSHGLPVGGSRPWTMLVNVTSEDTPRSPDRRR